MGIIISNWGLLFSKSAKFNFLWKILITLFWLQTIKSWTFKLITPFLQEKMPKNLFHHKMFDQCKRIRLESDGFYYTNKENVTKQIYGILYVKILVPRDNDLQNIGFLPTKMYKKNFVTLCRSCLVEMRTTQCDHCDDDRALIDWYFLAILFLLQK